MTIRWKTVLVLGLVVALIASLGLVGCAPSEEKPESEEPTGPEKGGTFSYYLTEPSFIDPMNGQESQGVQVISVLFDSLTSIDPETGELVAAAAESWSANDDATVFTFKLREDATFSDGTPVKASDFVFAWNRIATSPIKLPKQASEIAYHLAPVKGFDEAQEKGTDMEGVKAVDDYTFEVTLSYAWADFPFVTAHPAFAPVPQAAVEKDPAAYGEMPIGNGPFKMAEPWQHDQLIKTVKNDNYYGDESYVDGVDFKIYKDNDTGFRDFQAGNIDFLDDIPTGQIQVCVDTYGKSPDGFTVNPGEQTLLGAEAAIYYIAVNNTDPVLKDPKVRKALSLALNRQAITDTVYEGTREPADNFVPKSIPGYKEGVWNETEQDLEGAKALLAEAGYPEGKGLPTFKYNLNTGTGHEDVFQLLQSDWQKIGVKTEMVGLEFPQHIDVMQSGKYQLGRAGWIADYPIIDNFLYPEFTSGSADNWSKYDNPAVTEKLKAARQIVDDAERLAAYEEANATVGADFPVIPLLWYAHRCVGSDRVNGFVYDNMGLPHFEKAWLTGGGEGSSEATTTP